MDISAKHMLRKARDAANLSRLVASEALFAHQRALPAEHTGGEGMSYNPYQAQERHRRAQPRREAIRGADMARCAVITFAAVLMLLGVWILR